MANRARGISSPLLAMLATVFGSWSSAAADRPVVVPIRLLGNFPVVIVNIGGNEEVCVTTLINWRVDISHATNARFYRTTSQP